MQPASEPAPRTTPEQEKALSRVLKKQKNVLLDYARLRIRNAGLAHNHARVGELAQEAVQIALESVSKKAHEFDPSRSSGPWLKAFIHYAVLTLRKRENKHARLRLVGDAKAQRHLAEEYDPTDEELFAFLGGAQGRIDEPQDDPRLEWIREHAAPYDWVVIELRCQGYAGEALAQKLSHRLGTRITTGAATVRLHRAKQRLSDLYRKQQNQ